MKRKILSLVLAALMLCSVLPIVASAHSASMLQSEIFDNDAYFHMQYVKKQDYFKNQINLYTALGLYDRAWYNYFNGEVDIDYATTILLALVQKVDVEYKNQDFEKFIKVLETASSAADVINKVNKYTGLLDFAESSEWSTSISVLNDLIKAANYSNEMYEAFIRGYASILSARAASLYYSDLLQYLVDNCENEAVKKAAANILANINSQLEDAVKNLVAQLATSAAEDAVTAGVDIAMSSNTVTAAIKSAYKTSTGLANKLFKTSSKYGYMCSLAEIYYIEDCLTPWASAKLGLGDDQAAMKNFATSAFITLRDSGEQFIADLATTDDKTVLALAKDYNVDELKVRAASTIAKLSVIRSLFEAGNTDNFAAIYTSTGDMDLYVSVNDNVSTSFIGSKDQPLTKTDIGYTANIYNDTIKTFVKVVVLNATPDNVRVSSYNPTNTTCTYLQLDSVVGGALNQHFLTAAMVTGRNVVTNYATADYSGAAFPTATVKTSNGAYATAEFTSAFAVTPVELTFSAITGEPSPTPADTSFSGQFKAFFASFSTFFMKLFNILK